jgi:hypothetical protein
MGGIFVCPGVASKLALELSQGRELDLAHPLSRECKARRDFFQGHAPLFSGFQGASLTQDWRIDVGRFGTAGVTRFCRQIETANGVRAGAREAATCAVCTLEDVEAGSVCHFSSLG